MWNTLPNPNTKKQRTGQKPLAVASLGSAVGRACAMVKPEKMKTKPLGQKCNEFRDAQLRPNRDKI